MGRLRALVVATIAAALVATGLACAPIAAPSANATSRDLAVQQILADTNAIRAQLGLRPLVHNSSLDSVAQGWTQHQADAGAVIEILGTGSAPPSRPTRRTASTTNTAAAARYAMRCRRSGSNTPATVSAAP